MRWVERVREKLDLQPEGGAPFGPFEAGVLIVAAVGLAVMQFGSHPNVFEALFERQFITDEDPWHRWYSLASLLHWVAFCVIGYVLVPAIYLKLSGRSVAAFGYLGVRGFRRHLGIYFALFALVMLPVVVASYLPEFQQIYPFYAQASWSWFDLVVWELAYGVQFFALEFFFRGFMLEGLRRWIGYGAVFVMVVPYCMIHFQKAFAESMGSIVAGVVLGTLAIRYRSIWGGVMIHWLVAIAMDLLSLAHQGRLPKQLWP